MALPIIPETVIPNQSHVCHELVCGVVAVVEQFLADRREVHRGADDVEVVHNVELYRIDGLSKPKRAFKPTA